MLTATGIIIKTYYHFLHNQSIGLFPTILQFRWSVFFTMFLYEKIHADNDVCIL